MKKKYFEEQKLKTNKNAGITLIALVITIIVLLILAGISITMLTGNNGILQRATDAKNTTEQVQLDEDIDLAYLSYKTQLMGNNDQNTNLEDYLNNINNADIERLSPNIYYVSRNDYGITIDVLGEKEYGKVEVWDGTSQEPTEKTSTEIHIYKCSELKWLQEQVNSGTTFDGYTIYLENNLDFGARAKNGNWETDENEEIKWTPIGILENNTDTQALTNASFEGNNNSIKGIYLNSPYTYTGLFGITINSNINNLIISNSYINGENYVGGIVGILKDGIIENCNINDCIIKGNAGVGGITACISTDSTENLVQITNCNNNSTIIGKEGYAGGIFGLMVAKTNVTNCNNYGNIICTGEGIASGGYAGNFGGIGSYIYGTVYHEQIHSTIKQCKNYGEFKILESNTDINVSQIGGIMGQINSWTVVENCANFSNIDGNGNQIGGIIGCSAQGDNNSSNVQIMGCYNSGNISGKAYVGGIVGIFNGNSDNPSFSKCYNKGTVEGNSDVGGIVGKTAFTNFSKLFYKKSSEYIKAIGNQDDNTENKIMEIPNGSEDLSYEQFKTWIEEQ